MSILTSIKENKLRTIAVVVFPLILLVVIFMYTNKVAPISWGLYGDVNNENGIALQGGDAVAYFTMGEYHAGDANILFSTNGVTWYFASEENRQLFISTPDKYMPQYGGYCAFAISQNVTADAKPEFWTIQNEKLYVFNDEGVKQEWINDISLGSLSTSDSNWATRM